MDNCALVALQSYRVPKDRDFGIWTQARRVLYSAPVPSGAKGACSLLRETRLLVTKGSYLDALLSVRGSYHPSPARTFAPDSVILSQEDRGSFRPTSGKDDPRPCQGGWWVVAY